MSEILTIEDGTGHFRRIDELPGDGSALKIYVPASLLTTYQSATNWVRLSSHFVGGV